MINVRIWSDSVDCIDCGDEAAKWFSKCIMGAETGFRLAFYPSTKPVKNYDETVYLFERADQSDSGSLHEETSFMLMNQASFDDLNTRIEKPTGPLHYRPNFVVKGPQAWDEDNWKWVKIGGTIFKNVMPCVRCISTLVDPVTGTRDPTMESLKTLKTFRLFKNLSKTSPWFGIHLGLRGEPGKVRMGDEVFVA
jgi:uncharacterized protein YcbX